MGAHVGGADDHSSGVVEAIDNQISYLYSRNPTAMPSPFIKYIQNEQHYTEVISRVATVKESLWIGTADIKDLYVMKGKDAVPFLSTVAELLKKGVDVRLIHAKEPGQMFRDDFDKYPILATDLERVCCPRVHFKLMIFDTETAYIGSANLTGAGMGMKSETRRNFEAGILTNDPEFVESAINQFDNVWMGAYCKNCGRKICWMIMERAILWMGLKIR